MQELEKVLEEINQEKLKHWDPSERLETDKIMGWCFDKCTEIIRKHMNDKAADGGWTSVEERMPEERQYVLTTWEKPNYRKNTTEIYISVLKLNQEDEWTGDCGTPNGRVVAWQPLPEPYRSERRAE